VLQTARKIIQAAAPGAQESISSAIPTSASTLGRSSTLQAGRSTSASTPFPNSTSISNCN